MVHFFKHGHYVMQYKPCVPNDEVEIIDYVNLKHKVINTFGWFRFYKDREKLKMLERKDKITENFFKSKTKKK